MKRRSGCSSKTPEHRERAQHAVQRRLVQPGHLGQLRARARAVEQTAGQLVPESDLEHRVTMTRCHIWKICAPGGRGGGGAVSGVASAVDGFVTLLILASSREWPRPGGRGCPMTWINSAVRRRPHTNAVSDMFRPADRAAGTRRLQSRRGSHSRRAAPDRSGGARSRISPLDPPSGCPSRDPTTSTIGGRRATPRALRWAGVALRSLIPLCRAGKRLALYLVPSRRLIA